MISALYVIYGLVALVFPVARSLVLTGRTGLLASRRPGQFVMVFGIAVSVIGIWLSPWTSGFVEHVVGDAIVVVGIVVVVVGQWTMGDAWRVGVRADQATRLVTRGPYRLVRNPVYTGMFVVALGTVVAHPNLVTVAGLLLLIGGTEHLVRRAEEPYLVNAHGDSYLAWASRTGRFLPGVGLLHRDS